LNIGSTDQDIPGRKVNECGDLFRIGFTSLNLQWAWNHRETPHLQFHIPNVTMSLVKYLLSGLYAFGIYGAFMAGSIHLRTRSVQPGSPPRMVSIQFPRATILLLVAVGIPSILQFFHPAILVLFQRDYLRFLHGEWWRLITPLFVQDGGMAGTSFNMIGLLLAGILAEQFWGSLPVLLIFFSGGIVGEIAGFAWQPIGAGNSVANFALAGSILVAVLLRRPDKRVLIIALAVLSTYVLLLPLHDIHGVAAAAGVFLALMLGFVIHGKSRLQMNSE
jgi:membrane associated rhomboid family serine protease